MFIHQIKRWEKKDGNSNYLKPCALWIPWPELILLIKGGFQSHRKNKNDFFNICCHTRFELAVEQLLCWKLLFSISYVSLEAAEAAAN